MKKLLTLIIIGLLCFSMFSIFTPQVKAEETTIFSDNFESYAVGTFPSAGGWELVWNGAGDQYQIIIDTVSVSPTKSFQLLGSYGWSSVVKKDFSSTSNLIGYEVFVRTEAYGGTENEVAHVGFFNRPIYIWGRYYADVSFRDDGIIVSDSSVLQSYAPNTWYKVKVLLDKTTGIYNVWIDDVLKGQNFVEQNDPQEILSFELSSVWAGVKTYFDNVNVFAAAPPAVPDFEISIIPQPSVIVHVGGWNDSASLLLRSINGYSGSIQLSFKSSLSSITVSFSPNPAYLPQNGQVIVKMNITAARGELSSYSVEISATDGSITHKLILSIILVGNMVAINNLVQIQEANVENLPRWFTIQQNFFITAANGTIIYWGQNIVEVHQTLRNQYWLFSYFQIWIQRSGKPIFYPHGSARVVAFPIVLNLTSYIVGNELVMENNASTRGGRVTLKLPTDSYITVEQILDFSFAPQISLVGYGVMGRPPLEIRLLVAYFGWPTNGKVDSLVKLVGEGTWRSTQNAVFSIEQSSTAEQSRNLIWWTDGSFTWMEGKTDQGISFVPTYKTPP